MLLVAYGCPVRPTGILSRNSCGPRDCFYIYVATFYSMGGGAVGAYPRRHKVCLIQHKTCVIYIAELCVALALPFKLDSQVVSSLCDKSRTSRTYEHKLQEAPLVDFSQLLEKELRQPKISKINMFPFWQCFFFFLLLCKCQDTDRCAHRSVYHLSQPTATEGQSQRRG